MKIRLLTPRIILNKLHQPGDVVLLDDNLARLYIQNKLGEEVDPTSEAEETARRVCAAPL